ncbi:cardiolipin synthase [Cardiobacteriaceae bacterium TAE3-ERU3]|nr:cardiolipin synthase [Cardiobacteriaceae bacterium TAE3-ERU3]
MIWIVLHIACVAALTLRLLLRRDIAADARMAWFMVLILVPIAGYIAYFLFGEARMDKRARQRHATIFTRLREAAPQVFSSKNDSIDQLITKQWRNAFRYSRSINQFIPLDGNNGELMADGATARARMLEDMRNATKEINVLYYIWLNDKTGTDIAEAMIDAAKRGVTCRAMVDGLGSRAFIHSPQWQAMKDAGVITEIALPFHDFFRTLLRRRIDLRNHRKITIIDDEIVYCGSQNCADEAFAVKAKFAPWVDILLRCSGPLVAQSKLLFASDWLLYHDEPIENFVIPIKEQSDGFPAAVMGFGPTERQRATPQLLMTLIDSAKHTLTISTPYFVPDALLLNALCSAALRGVNVTLIFPERNDSWIVAAVSRSHYYNLLSSGITIHEYQGGLLHAKTLTIDDQVTLIGSTNLDLRSFDLNYENNILLQDETVTHDVLERQQYYISKSQPVTFTEVQQWSYFKRMWHNAMGAIGPLL